jgi:dihydroorotase-like cyclic amidohydrolase
LIRRWLLPGHILIKISAAARRSPFFGISPPLRDESG